MIGTASAFLESPPLSCMSEGASLSGYHFRMVGNMAVEKFDKNLMLYDYSIHRG